MKYEDWENMVNEQAIAFSALCAQNARLSALVDKHDEDESAMTEEEYTEMINRFDTIMDNPFFFRRRVNDARSLEEEDDPLEHESNVDLFGPWWE